MGEGNDTGTVQIKVIVNETKDNEGFVLTPLVFRVEDIAKLRKLGICGILSGTLPSAAQQNIFLSIPLKLMVEEAVWLYLNGFATLNFMKGPTTTIVKNILKEHGREIEDNCRHRMDSSFTFQRQYKRIQHLEKLAKLGIKTENKQNNGTTSKLMEASLFVETMNESDILGFQKPDSTINEDSAIDLLISSFSDWDNYLMFQSLREKDYVLSPGARFGGRFIGYPGDPLRYHSHMTIQNVMDYYKDPIDMTLLTGGARLGTSVKKLWVIGGIKKDKNVEKDPEVKFFSIEWAGFG